MSKHISVNALVKRNVVGVNWLMKARN